MPPAVVIQERALKIQGQADAVMVYCGDGASSESPTSDAEAER